MKKRGVQRVQQAMRGMVARNRKKEKEAEGLDIVFVTDRILAMSYPCDDMWQLVRNPYDDVKRYLDNRFHGCYRVYSLCREMQHDPSKFNQRYAHVPMQDHFPATLQQTLELYTDIHAFLDEDSSNVAVIHCKGGKGRTGFMIVSVLVLGQTLGATAAMQHFAFKRTKNQSGVVNPSQIRFLRYIEYISLHGLPSPPYTELRAGAKPVVLSSIRIHGLQHSDRFMGIVSFDLYITVSDFGTDTELFDSRCVQQPPHPFTIGCNIGVRGDTCVTLWNRNGPFFSDMQVCYCCFHTCFVPPSLRLAKSDLDVAYKDRSHRRLPPSFGLTLYFDFL